MKRIFTNEEFLTQYNKQLTDAELARKFNCTQSAIYYYRKRNNLPKNMLKSKKLDLEQFKVIFREDLPNNELAIMLNTSTKTIEYYRTKLKLPSFNKNDIELNDFERSFLLGLMLGDGHLRCYNNTKTAWGSFAHSLKQEAYVKYKIDILNKLFTKCSYKEIHDKRTLKTYTSLNVYLKSCKELYNIYEAIYDSNKVKRFVNKEYLYKNFTEISLAILIGDDGSNATSGIQIATNSFNIEDLKFLQTLLYEKFRITCNIRKNNTIYIPAGSKRIVQEICYKYLPKSLYYKIE
jgi:DNA-binding CsgD family transcriptional regulator